MKQLNTELKISKANHPVISIITVVFNGDKTLEKTIQGVVSQTYKNTEYIIIDGGSTDTTVDIIKKYENSISYWVSEKDNGIYDAMNKGIDIAKGEWIYFLGADDILYDILHKVADKLDNHLVALYGDVYMPSKHKIYNGKFSKFKLMFNNICHQAIFYNRKVFKDKKFDTKYRLLADYAFNILIFNEKSFKYTPILVAYYNDIDGVSSNGSDRIFQNNRINMVKQYIGYKYYLFFKFRKYFVNILELLHIKALLKRYL